MVDAHWEVEAPDILKFVLRVPKEKKGQKPGILVYRIDISAMPATWDETKSTGTCAKFTLNYTGPAPKKK